MAEDDPVNQRLHRKFEDAFGEPEATEVMNRLATTHDLRIEIISLGHQVEREMGEIRGEIKELRADIKSSEERLRAEFQTDLRKNMTTMLTVMGIFNGVVFTALGLVLA